MICDAAGNLVIAGRSNSFSKIADATKDYPTLLPRTDPVGGYDIVVTKFNATGTGINRLGRNRRKQG